ncbi:MAG: DNA/RNA nuclease SfsA [Gammaproteobacteria bacterium]|nr:DNA/RNA nuclease SfsA [Gammaproteobacteria bacterium]
MQFDRALIEAVLIKRYKRFLADVTLENGEVVTAHTPNTGSMKGCSEPGCRVWLLDSENPKRKYPLGWELIEVKAGVRVGINTHLSNKLVKEAIENGVINELQAYETIRTEVPYGAEKSRIDLLLQQGEQPDCYVEVKNVTWVEEGIAYFPDAVSVRGQKHLRELMAQVELGFRAVLLFCLQRNDATEVRPADQVDPEYGRLLRQAMAVGVEVLAYQADPTPEGISLSHAVPVVAGVEG